MAADISLQEPVKAAIRYALDNYIYNDAVFLAERLHAEVDSLDSAYLLATCYYRSSRVQQAKYLLGRHRSVRNPKCDLLYAQCCLHLKEYKDGLLALRGLLCTQDPSEDKIASHFGEDAGVAFWLLGEINRRIHLHDEAKKHFRSCLRHNPFLWSAYQTLCEMGESPSEQCFTVSTYPQFLKFISQPAIISTTDLSSTGAANVVENNASHTQRKDIHSKQHSAFTPIDANRVTFITPDLFGNPPLGKAVASSTPVQRSLPFTVKPDSKPEPVPPRSYCQLDTEGNVPSSRRVSFGSVRAALTFGSGCQSNSVGREEVESGASFTPSFGLLPFTLTPHPTITPSPMALPTNYLKLLQSAPKSTGIVKPTRLLTPDSSNPLITPPALTFDSPFETPPLHPPTDENEEELLSPGDDSIPTSPPLMMTTPTMPPPKAPMKSANLRRSARLMGGVGKSSSSMSNSKRRSDIGPSGLALHSTRAKSRIRETTSKKGSKVTFSSPTSTQKPSHRRSYPITPLQGSHSHQENESPQASESQELFGEWGGSGRDPSHLVLEQAVMTNIASLMNLLQQIAVAYQALYSYDLVRAIQLFHSLPPRHYHTPWVLSQEARAFFVGERFKESAKLYGEVHRMDPHRQEGMELYASALWHHQKEVTLSVLAEKLQSSDKLRPEGLCAMASVMNLYKDHESAVKFLQRAIQVSPTFTYAYTLLGHEYWLVKDYDKSLASFREALAIDPRHFNAWYGLSHVHFTQEKYRFSQVYAARALDINKCSSIICTQLALAHFRQTDLKSALETLEKAIVLNRNNPIPKFHRAKVLEAMGRLEEAVEQLDDLTGSWPKEPNLYISKGKLLKRLNRPHEAVLNFSWALDFSRSGSNSQIREEIDQVYNPQNTSATEEGDSDFIPHSDLEEESDDSMRSV